MKNDKDIMVACDQLLTEIHDMEDALKKAKPIISQNIYIEKLKILNESRQLYKNKCNGGRK